MRSGVLSLMFASGMLAVLLLAQPAAGVNCDQVRRYLQTGRSVEDIADTMVVSVDEVKKCQQSAGADKSEQKPAPTPAAPKKAGS